MAERKLIAVFDFDGTLTTKDTLIEFIRYACGKKNLYIGFLLHSPLLVLMKLHFYPNWKAKEKMFSWFFKGMNYKTFASLGHSFASQIAKIKREETHKALHDLQASGADIYIITASIEEWIRPYCNTLGVKDVLGTKIEIDASGILTGRFLTKNCYGQEKVNRLLNVEPNRNEYRLIAYGDSSGDKEMIAFADEGQIITT